MTVCAKYETDDLEIHYTAETERNDYGVPGSPVWYEVNPDTVNVLSINILGVDVRLKDLPTDLQNAILSLSTDLDFE
jgi:hypothetical protein